jgi:3-hydroxy-9,10-secoandrosta-1,3,5(10)-triene-9,17-dione monooxygenase reductase component
MRSPKPYGQSSRQMAASTIRRDPDSSAGRSILQPLTVRERSSTMAPGSQQDDFRSVLGRFASGVNVVTALSEGQPIGITMQAFCALSLDPPLILVCPSQQSTTWPRIAAAGAFCVNVLSGRQTELARRFALSGVDKFSAVQWTPSSASGSPKLDALAWIDCEIEDTHPGGDHLLVVGRVKSLQLGADEPPLIFFRSAFTCLA